MRDLQEGNNPRRPLVADTAYATFGTGMPMKYRWFHRYFLGHRCRVENDGYIC